MISRVEDLIMAGKPPKMAQRIVNVEISSQGELMKEIFPRAKSVIWDQVTGIPVMIKLIDGFCSGFRGFLTGEELNNVVRFAETPQRVSQAQNGVRHLPNMCAEPICNSLPTANI